MPALQSCGRKLLKMSHLPPRWRRGRLGGLGRGGDAEADADGDLGGLAEGGGVGADIGGEGVAFAGDAVMSGREIGVG